MRLRPSSLIVYLTLVLDPIKKIPSIFGNVSMRIAGVIGVHLWSILMIITVIVQFQLPQYIHQEQVCPVITLIPHSFLYPVSVAHVHVLIPEYAIPQNVREAQPMHSAPQVINVTLVYTEMEQNVYPKSKNTEQAVKTNTIV